MSRKYKDREYPKWVITVPPRQIQELGWAEGEFLESNIQDKELIIKRENIQKTEKRREVARRAWETRKKRGNGNVSS